MKKKIVAMALGAAVIAAAVSACGAAAENKVQSGQGSAPQGSAVQGSAAHNGSQNPPETGLNNAEMIFHQVKTHLTGCDTDTSVITSLEEWNAFDERNGHVSETEEFQLEVGSGFDEVFFQDNILLCAPMEAGSGSDWFMLTDVYDKDGKLTMMVATDPAQVGTADMVTWFFMAAIPKDQFEELPTSFDLVLNRRKG